jgi:predicted Fe-Mo cluster-binding NifX family protein
MKIAAVSEDGITISRHFGRAPYYVVVTVENGAIVSREQRDKMNHAHFAREAHGHDSSVEENRGHGYDPASQSRHRQMASAIADCDVLLARGMGAGAYESLRSANIRPVVTDLAGIEDAVSEYLKGTLVDHAERLH